MRLSVLAVFTFLTTSGFAQTQTEELSDEALRGILILKEAYISSQRAALTNPSGSWVRVWLDERGREVSECVTLSKSEFPKFTLSIFDRNGEHEHTVELTFESEKFGDFEAVLNELDKLSNLPVTRSSIRSTGVYW